MKNVYMTKKKVHISCWIHDIAYHILTSLVMNNNVWMDLSHQVNTISTINIFCMSNITTINFDITYYLADTYCWWIISFNLFLKLEIDGALPKSSGKLFQVLIAYDG